jgi:stearoyl-CoA desaturase (delta-9 desaturase)
MDRVDWKTATPLLFLHVAAIFGLIITPWSWKGVLLCIGMYYFRMWALSSFFHRYFSHRSFKTGRVFQAVMAVLGTLTVQNGVLWWAANHRHHHRFSDLPADLHSPTQNGLWWAHMGWVLSYRSNETRWDLVRDLTKYPEILWINRHWLLIDGIAAAALYLAGGWFGLFWGGVLSTVVLFHGTSTVNSLAHVWGSRRYDTTDTSRNNLVIALLSMGEGWHNNHHHYQSSARQGFFWWEVDMSYYVLKLLEVVGLVWDVREPPQAVLAASREARSLSSPAGAEMLPPA